MAFVTGDVIPSGDAEFPFKIVFMQGDTLVSEWFVQSKEDGEAEIIENLQRLAEEEDEEEVEEVEEEAAQAS